MLRFTRYFATASFLLAASVVPTISQAADMKKPSGYPNRPVEVVVRSGAGSGSEAFARVFTQHLSDKLGFTFKYSFMPGADGTISSSYLLDQPADGYTIYIASPTQLINILRGKVKYSLADWTWLARTAYELSALHVLTSNKEISTFQDVLDHCKKEKKIKITVAGAGAISFDRVWVELLNQAMGTNCLKFVPFNKSSNRRASFLGGHTTLISGELAEMHSHFKSGTTKPIVVGSEVRVPGDYADLKTTKDYGINVFLGRWRGVSAKAGTPQEIVDYLEWAFEESFNSKPYQHWLNSEPGLDVSRYLGPAAWKKSMNADLETLGGMLKSLGLL